MTNGRISLVRLSVDCIVVPVGVPPAQGQGFTPAKAGQVQDSRLQISSSISEPHTWKYRYGAASRTMATNDPGLIVKTALNE